MWNLGFITALGYVPTGLYWYQTMQFDSINATAEQGQVFCDTNNNVGVAGIYRLSSTDRMLISKVNSNGSTVWAEGIRAGNFSIGKAIARDSLNNSYAGGYAFYSDAEQGLLVKHSVNGTREWARTIGDINIFADTFYNSVVIDPSDGIYMASSLEVSSTNSDIAMVLTKWTTAGTLSFQRRLVISGSAVGANAAAVDANGIVIGCNGDTLVKYNTSGTLQWQKRWNTDDGFDIFDVALDSSSNIYALGTTSTFNMYLVKFNSSGAVQWQKRLIGSNIVLSRLTTSGTSIFITGRISTSNSNDGLIVKINESGVIQWARRLGRVNFNDVIHDNAIDSNGNMILLSSPSFSLTKLPSDGSMTGNYAIDNGQILSYSAANITIDDDIYTISNGTATSSTPSYTVMTPSLTANTPSTLVVARSEI
jgi:hypothetical protein